MPTKGRPYLDKEIDALFRLPLAEFTTARNALAVRLRKEGRAIDVERVKSLSKPPAPAWAVNQLYWEKPKAIEELVAVAERIRKEHTGRGKNADLRQLLDEKKQMMAGLTERAAEILRAGGHSASPDAMRRVSATLESVAVWGMTKGAPEIGRLTDDLDPPGFEALAAVMGGASIESAKLLTFRARKPVEDPAAARIRARNDLKAAEKALRDRTREADEAQRALAKANARAAALEKQKEEIEARHAEATEEARAASVEAKKAARALADAERSVARAKAAAD